MPVRKHPCSVYAGKTKYFISASLRGMSLTHIHGLGSDIETEKENKKGKAKERARGRGRWGVIEGCWCVISGQRQSC